MSLLMTAVGSREPRSSRSGSSRFARGVLLAAVGAVLVVAVGPVGVALGLTIERPSAGALLNTSQPTFAGTTQDTSDFNSELNEEVFDPITLVIAGAAGAVVQRLAASTQLYSSAWSAAAAPLADGAYTAQAIQTRTPPGEVVGQSAPPLAFTIDTTAPTVAIATPANGSSSSGGLQPVSGSAGVAAGDLPAIMIRLFAGAPIRAQVPLETLVVQAVGEGWAATFGGLAPGTYTAQAAQADQAGNTGVSAPVTFTVLAASPPPPPAASFKWFPPAPRTGETVSLVSSSSDSFSPITGFAWALSSNGPFAAGKPVLTTSFATAGSHVVRLQVTDANGATSVAAESVPVSGRPILVMQPFPIVRIAGVVTSRGAKLRLLTVQAPIAAKVTVACVGHGCVKSESQIATTSSKAKAGAVTLAFPRFERALRAGVTLQIRVTKDGEIGKYTSFAIRRSKLPVRSDACLQPTSTKPTPCPSS